MAENLPTVGRRMSISAGLTARRIYVMRGRKVMVDADLAELYQVSTKALNQAVKRNLSRFPEDFMFRLNDVELEVWRSQIVTSNSAAKMGLRRAPYAFTEHGVAMLSSVLNSKRAVQMNIFIIRVFMKLREVLATHKNLARKVEQLEAKQKDHAVMLGLIAGDIESLTKNVRKEFKRLGEPRRRKARIGFVTDQK
jgi:hypothetical protein